MTRTIDPHIKFMVDGLDPKHDGAGTPWYALQTVDKNHGNAKVAVVYAEHTTGVLTEVLRIDAMIGAPSIVIRPDGTAYICGGGRENTIVTGVSIPTFVPLLTTTALAAALAALRLALTTLTEETP